MRRVRLSMVNYLILCSRLRFCGDIPPHIRLSGVHSYVLPLWTGDLRIFRYLRCRGRLWTHVWLTGACRLTWPGGFPQLRFPSWCEHSISQSSDPQKIGCPEYCMVKCSIDLGGETWLGRYNMANWGHVSDSGLRGLPDKSISMFALALPWTFAGLPKLVGNTRGIFLTLLRFLGNIYLLENLRRYLKVQWFSLWWKIKRSLSSHPKRSPVDYSLAMFYIVIPPHTIPFSTSSKLVDSWYNNIIKIITTVKGSVPV